MDLEYPKVLLVTNSSFNSFTGTGIMLTNLFKGWPQDRIASVHMETYPVDKDICRKFYKLGEDEIRWRWPASIFKYCGSNKSIKNTEKEKEKKYFLVRYISMIILNVIGLRHIFLRKIVSTELTKWVKEFNPDIIYCHISTLEDIRFIQKLSSIRKTPLAIHIMDDWLNVRYSGGILSSFLRYYFRKAFRRLLSQTAARMVIGDKMGKCYKKRYGYSFVIFSNAVDPAVWMKKKEQKEHKDDCFNMVYAGTMNDKNIVNLGEIGEIVKKLNLTRYNIRFKIFTFQPMVEKYRMRYESKPDVTIGEVPRSDEDMSCLLRDADLLVLPVDFTKESIQRMRYSIFAKILAYMMSGTPILMYGPAEIASVEYAVKEKWAYVVSRKNGGILKEAVIKLYLDKNLRIKLGHQAQKIALRDFDASKIRPAFRKALLDASEETVS